LPFVSKFFVESVSGYPSMVPISNSALKYYFIARPDIRPVCFLWKENSFIGFGETIPGIDLISIKTVQACEYTFSRISNIRVQMLPSLLTFEQVLLDRMAYNHAKQFPESKITENDAKLNPPVILERRLHLGYHNTFTFLHPPTIINLQTSFDENGVGNELHFLGNIQLEKYFPNINEISLIFMIEYKVSLTVRASTQNSNWHPFKMFDSKNKEDDSSIQNIEKFVSVCWGSWNSADTADPSKF
jgi:hypothetical protein